MPRDKFREPAVRYRDKLKGLLPCRWMAKALSSLSAAFAD
jgi:hypothetical protein